jgi:hypothetical protein
MTLRLPSGALAAAATLSSVTVLSLTACGGGGDGDGQSATDGTTGITVTVADDSVKLKRSAKSTSGTGGTSGTVSCTDNYTKLAKATGTPAPTEAWYATTYITWPATGQESSARLSHSLKGDPQLCIVQTSDQSASAVIYFNAKVKTAVNKLQTDSARSQQAQQADSALQSAAQAAVQTVAKGRFPAAGTLLSMITSQGLYAKTAASQSAVADPGTLYILTSETTTSKLVMAIKDSSGKVHLATQGTTGSPKLTTAK